MGKTRNGSIGKRVQTTTVMWGHRGSTVNRGCKVMCPCVERNGNNGGSMCSNNGVERCPTVCNRQGVMATGRTNRSNGRVERVGLWVGRQQRRSNQLERPKGVVFRCGVLNVVWEGSTCGVRSKTVNRGFSWSGNNRSNVGINNGK